MIFEHLTEKALTTLGDRLVDVLATRIRGNSAPHVRVSKPNRDLVRSHLRMIQKWAAEISFRDLTKPKRLTESFVDLDLLLGNFQSKREGSRKRQMRVSDILHLSGNFVLLGDPGAGKTTSLKRLALGLLQNATSSGRYPVLITLRDFAEQNSLAPIVLAQVGSYINFDSEIEDARRRLLTNRAVQGMLNDHSIVLLIDGLDEMNPRARDGMVADLRSFLLNVTNAQIILTCRTADYTYHLESSSVMTLRPLTDEQIVEFSLKWLGAAKSTEFNIQLAKTPYKGTEVRPLNLAHLCAIFERSGTIPEKPKTVYRKIVRLMLEEWDEQRSVRRYSRYANFEVDRKEEFLEALAYRLTFDCHSASFTHTDIHEAYLRIHDAFGLPRNEASRVVREIESHTGLILETSYEKYEFSHKSIQEYLTAAFALKLPDPPLGVISRFPNESALLIALSSDPNRYFSLIVGALIGIFANSPSQVEPFVRRIAVERVDFKHSDLLAYDVLRLAAATYGETEPHAFLDFMRLPAVSESIFELLKRVEFSKNNDSYVIDAAELAHPTLVSGWAPRQLVVRSDIINSILREKSVSRVPRNSA